MPGHPSSLAATGKAAFAWQSAALLALALLLPAFLLGWVAWGQWKVTQAEVERTAQRTAAALQEHALRVLETDELLLGQIEREIAGRDWDVIQRDPGVRRYLAELAGKFAHVRAIGLWDARGRLRGSSLDTAMDVSAADRDYFQWHRQGRPDPYISAAHRGDATGVTQFFVSKSRLDASGAFDGVIGIAVSLDYFANFWKQFAPSVAYVIPLLREDGTLLARYPAEAGPERLDPTGSFMQQLRRSPRGVYTAVSQVDGRERINAYTKVGKYPLYISFSIETGAVLNHWREDVAVYALFFAMATLALMAMSVMMIRHTRREHAAAERWHEVARRLQAEIERRKAAEDSMRQAQKMEALGQITGGVAHDFNNVLQVINNSLYMARKASGETPAGRLIQAAMAAVQKGSRLTSQLLAFSRREPLSRRPVETTALVAGMKEMLQASVGSRVRLEFDIAPDTWSAMTDANQAEMAILNLAVNARDAMPQGGSLTIRTANVCVGTGSAGAGHLPPGDYVLVSVEDTGVGMREIVARRALEPFFTTKESGKGTGLGLSQVGGFAAQSGGGVSIDSAPGSGTRVRLYLPRAEVPAPAAAKSPAPAAAPGAETILLVDDEASVRETTASTLELEGYSVQQAASADEALEILRTRDTIALLITDFAMPGMRGTELARRAQSLRPGVRVLLLTGHVDLALGAGGGWRGMTLAKPFTPDELIAMIGKLRGQAAELPAR